MIDTKNSSLIPAGYKQTEVGVIPEDWDVKSLLNIAVIQRGASPRPIDSPVWFDANSPTGWLRISDVSKVKKYLIETSQSLSLAGIANSRFVESGNLVMSICATVGRPVITMRDVCIHDGFVVFRNLNVDRDYLYYFLEDIEKDWGKQGQTGSQMNLNTRLINSSLIALPPSLAEQQAIAEALSDVDELIGSLEKLIAKKRAIKTGAMQQLLTGKQRLPGFEGEWETKRLGDILSVCHGKSQHEISQAFGIYPILATGGEIGRTNEFLYDKPSVLIGRKGTIDRPQYVDQPFWTIDTLFYTEISEKNVAKFVYYKFCMIDWRRYNEASGVPSLNASTIEKIEIVIPSTKEQQAIAEVLSDMDAEIQALNAKLDKTQAIKQGMMSELLTGQTRLVSHSN